jgi:hypothetical protein
MVKLFFITVLVLSSHTPKFGWMQWTQSYSSKGACEEMVGKDYEKIIDAVKAHLGKDFRKAIEIRCLTYDEARDKNSELGH